MQTTSNLRHKQNLLLILMIVKKLKLIDICIFMENESYVFVQFSRKMSNFEINPHHKYLQISLRGLNRGFTVCIYVYMYIWIYVYLFICMYMLQNGMDVSGLLRTYLHGPSKSFHLLFSLRRYIKAFFLQSLMHNSNTAKFPPKHDQK